MLTFQWNALRTGGRVLVHDDDAPDLATESGVVAIVRTRRGSTNDVAIRSETTGRIVRPRRLAVHLLPPDRRFSCWRCDAAARSGTADGLAA
jgi:hypothetical protein